MSLLRNRDVYGKDFQLWRFQLSWEPEIDAIAASKKTACFQVIYV